MAIVVKRVYIYYSITAGDDNQSITNKLRGDNTVIDGAIEKDKTLREKMYTHSLTISVALMFSLSVKAFGATSITQGFTPLTSDTINISTTGSGSSAQAYNAWGPSAFTILQNSASKPCGNIALTTLDGYSGILLASGVLLVIYNSNLTGMGGTSVNYNITKTNTWDANGIIKNSPSKSPYCFDVRSKASETLKQNIVYKTTGTVNVGIYVAPNTPAVTVTVPQLDVARLNTGSNVLTQKLSSSGMVIDVNHVNCTVSMPTTVPFGSITNKTDPIVVSQMISLQCSGGSTATNVSYHVTPKSGSGTATTIPMKNTASGNKVGDIRGFLNSNGAVDAGCQDTGSSMMMNGTSQNLSLGLASNMVQQIPVNWTLCPSLNAVPGPASAALSFDITW